MEKTPLSMRKHIAVVGRTNAGKSSLFNGLLGQEVAIVSNQSGTTTDPVIKAAELLDYGAVALVDTAGLGDETVLGTKRIEKTIDVLNRCDLLLWVRDITNLTDDRLPTEKIPAITVFTKCDIAKADLIEQVKKQNPEGVFIFGYSEAELEELKKKMAEELKKQQSDTETMLGDIVNAGETVVMVVPIDSAAPKGRLILPQVQAIRDCLDNNIRAVCVKPELLEKTLEDIPDPALVVTDSQIFGEVAEAVPEDIPLTSFSMLLANQKGRITQLIEGTKKIAKLRDGSKILMLEACTHSTTHEDIGKVKIPMLLQKKTGKKLEFTHLSGYDFPTNIRDFDLVIQCGGCMINKKTIQNRLEILEEKGIPVTNYGVVLAYLNGISDRASKIFIKD